MVHLVCLLSNLLNIPYWDEWDFFALPTGINFESLKACFALHNVHVIAFVKMAFLVLREYFGSDFRYFEVLNVFLFAVYFLIVLKLVLKKFNLNASLFLVLLIPLSTLAWENHHWGIQFAFRLGLIFWFIMLYLSCVREVNLKTLSLMTLLTPLSVVDMSFGLVISAFCSVTLLARAFFKKRSWTSGIYILPLLAALTTYKAVYPHNDTKELLSHLFVFDVWHYFVSLSSLGFGAESVSWDWFFGLKLLSMFAFKIFKLLKKKELHNYNLPFVICGLASLATGMLIAIHHGVHEVVGSKASRYSELMWPFALSLVALYYQEFESLRPLFKRALLLGWILFLANNFDYTMYARIRDDRQFGLDCLKTEQFKEQIFCNSIHVLDLKSSLEAARRANASFLTDIKE